ncbi:Similar to hypothetical protein CMQ_4659 [Grosmannia clavigera kw1407]; acc. no. EFW98807 [Pyronema omphalodes CBS 100304]|uniref:Uncharacterized protein n=1 Tax=Pyronema omphalodes (strain CBS 100304) TaxID=1076935 RepID=U4LIE9_PYROM|nr:Similar to hypothetical protein CMQ_4659 [Grosmannia clavigera kw1407]; acc. no. EFW98807 [Pyronema omphalodes CBS 100304]
MVTERNQHLISLKEINDWRVFLMSLISRDPVTESQNDALIQDHAIPLINAVRGLAKQQEQQFLDERLVALVPILKSAAKLYFLMWRQRANWVVKYPWKDALLDPKVMKEHDIDGDDDVPAKAKRVDMYLFPGLFKRGNADGEGYTEESVVAKAQVVCVAER